MNIERATSLTSYAHQLADYMHCRTNWEERPPTFDSTDEWDCFGELYSGEVMEVEGVLGLTDSRLAHHGHRLTLTEGLARARYWLTQITDPPPSIRRHVDECLMIVDAALAALDLTSADPLLNCAAWPREDDPGELGKPRP